MKLSNKQNELLKKVTSVEKRRDVRNDMKSLIKEIESTEWIMEECKGVNRDLPIWDHWTNEINRKTNQLLEIERKLSDL